MGVQAPLRSDLQAYVQIAGKELVRSEEAITFDGAETFTLIDPSVPGIFLFTSTDKPISLPSGDPITGGFAFGFILRTKIEVFGATGKPDTFSLGFDFFDVELLNAAGTVVVSTLNINTSGSGRREYAGAPGVISTMTWIGDMHFEGDLRFLSEPAAKFRYTISLNIGRLPTNVLITVSSAVITITTPVNEAIFYVVN